LVTVALNLKQTECELAEASHRGGVRFCAGALTPFVFNRFVFNRSARPENPQQPLNRQKPLNQSYTRLSGSAQAGIFFQPPSAASLGFPPQCASRVCIDSSVFCLADRPLQAEISSFGVIPGVVGGTSAFLVSR
jgi:hypothetical protein